TMLVRGDEVLVVAFEARAALAHRERDDTDDDRATFARLEQGEVAVNDAFARHFAVSPGDELELQTPQGPRSFRIAGGLPGMEGRNGLLFVALATFDSFWPRPGAEFVRLFVTGEPAAVVDAARSATYSRQSLFFADNAELLARAKKFAARFDGLLFGVAA